MINSCNDSLQTIYQEIGSRYYVENQCQPEEQYEGLFQQGIGSDRTDRCAEIGTGRGWTMPAFARNAVLR